MQFGEHLTGITSILFSSLEREAMLPGLIGMYIHIMKLETKSSNVHILV